MPYRISYNPETGFVEAKVQGAISFNEIKEIYSKYVQTTMENESFLYLADYREAILDLSTMELYDLPTILADIVAPLGINVHKLRRAVVIAKGLKDKRLGDYRFYETVTLNRWQHTKLFEDLDEAKQWLSEK
ncbi:MAG: hypothetical protein KF749_04290 [Bacteroidetes bacterium]|nr:hypothetical protein [Bacteroidota bacterium]MCW5897596.1 hypothetical protein [Bacteroidota bacterium]